MNRVVEQYICQSLANGGLVVLGLRASIRVRPDLWATSTNCGGDWSEALPVLPAWAEQHHVRTFSATLANGDTVKVLAWNDIKLKERLSWIGVDAVEITEAQLAKPDQSPAVGYKGEPRWDEDLVKLASLAREQPPTPECALRTDILKARRILEERGIKWDAD